MLCFPNLRISVHASLPKYTALAASADGCLQHMATTKWTLLFEHPINRTFAAVIANVSHIICPVRETEWDIYRKVYFRLCCMLESVINYSFVPAFNVGFISRIVLQFFIYL